MKGRELQDKARQVAKELVASTSGYPFGPEYEVFKVRGKVFLLLTEMPGDPVVVLKANPEESEALRQSYPEITPGYHMNKRHWITLAPGESIDEDLVQELVTESYRLVVANLSQAHQPVDPETLEAYKVAGEVFLIVTDDPGERISTVKAQPDVSRNLRRDYPSITRGQYLDKTHWVSVGAGQGINKDFIEDLVTESYELVRESLPQKDQATKHD